MLRTGLRNLLLVFCLVGVSTAAQAVPVDKPLDDPVLEARARVIHKQLRCLVCQNQSIDDSNAELARDLRILVRDRIAAGDSDEATVEYIVARYGDWVLLRPPLKAKTILLWFSPVAFIISAFGVIAVWFRRRRRLLPSMPPELSAAERVRLKELLEDGDFS